MFACIALLLPKEVQNVIRSKVLEVATRHNLQLVASLLPQHISLKISFKVDEINGVEKYLDDFTKGLSPVKVKLLKTALIPIDNNGVKTGILWIDVEGNHILRGFHSRLNEDLQQKFGIGKAEFDGEKFHFHTTLFHNGAAFLSLELYKKAFEDLKDIDFGMECSIHEIALFVSPNDKEIVAGEFITYKVLELNGEKGWLGE